MQAFGGANSDPDSWDVFGEYLAYGAGSCVIVQNINTYVTLNYLPLKHNIVTCVKFTTKGLIVAGTCDGYVLILDPTKTFEPDQPIKPIFSQKYPSSITRMSVSEHYLYISTALHGTRLFEFKESDEPDHILFYIPEDTYKDKTPNGRSIAVAVYECYNSFIAACAYPDGSVHIFVPQTDTEVTIPGNAWCQSVKFSKSEDGSLRFASASQDKIIRVWKILPVEEKESELEMSVKEINKLKLPDGTVLTIELLANLAGHTDWVNCIDFFGTSICSASYDGQVLLWTELVDEGSGVIDYDITYRLGSAAVVDDQSGMTGCKLLGPRDIMSVSRNGGFSHWINGTAVRSFAGHTDIVSSCCWSTEGFFLTAGMDKVARCYGADENGLFAEFARPLIHGHALHDVAQVRVDKFAITADEKEIRILQPTSNFAKLVGPPLSEMKLPFASMVPPLNLSNKILETAESVPLDFNNLTGADFVFDGIPPAHSMWLTRWPEVDAIFGHFREITKLGVAKTWIGSGDDRGGVVIRDAQKRRFITGGTGGDDSVQKSAVTAVSVAPDELSLLTVCKNGIVRLFDSMNGTILTQVTVGQNALCCDWDVSGNYFAVGSEDGLTIFEKDGQLSHQEKIGHVTAVSILDDFRIIVGLNDGSMKIYSYDVSSRTLTFATYIIGHSERVNAIKVNKNTNKILSCSNDHTVLLQNLI